MNRPPVSVVKQMFDSWPTHNRALPQPTSKLGSPQRPSIFCIFDTCFPLGLCLHVLLASLGSPSSFELRSGSPPHPHPIFSPPSEASTTNFCLIFRSYFLEVDREHKTAFCNLPPFPVVNLFQQCVSPQGDGASPSSRQDVAYHVREFMFRAHPVTKRRLLGLRGWGMLFGSPPGQPGCY